MARDSVIIAEKLLYEKVIVPVVYGRASVITATDWTKICSQCGGETALLDYMGVTEASVIDVHAADVGPVVVAKTGVVNRLVGAVKKLAWWRK